MHIAQSAPALKSTSSEMVTEHRKIVRMSAELKENDSGAWTVSQTQKKIPEAVKMVFTF